MFAANSDWAKSHEDDIKTFISVFREAIKKAGTDKAAADHALTTYVELTDQAQMDDVVASYKDVWEVAPYPEDELQSILDSLVAANPPVKGASSASPSDLIDNSYLDAQ